MRLTPKQKIIEYLKIRDSRNCVGDATLKDLCRIYGKYMKNEMAKTKKLLDIIMEKEVIKQNDLIKIIDENSKNTG